MTLACCRHPWRSVEGVLFVPVTRMCNRAGISVTGSFPAASARQSSTMGLFLQSYFSKVTGPQLF
uniref:Uncharacterized protein n=1 Tax=Utricularia reniformis TaxID=192314 RepID=A0A1Y0AYT1_9LAMI|nr:hypothetical protein AEK19_MT0794 [Utricularia reniformis]ART30313.1 hypothetical protein AEK19_MT0794 [Utricularia reniformis]